MNTETPPRLRDLSAGARWLLVFLVLAGAALRVLWQYDRPFVNDEGGTILHIRNSYGYLLTHFSDPWLSMNVYLCVAKFMSELTGGARWALVLPGLLASLAAIPLMASFALRAVPPRMALLAAAFMAFNPYLVEFGVTIRAYSFFVLGVIGLYAALFDWFATPGWRHGWRFAGWMFFALLMHLNTAYYLLFAGPVVLGWLWRARGGGTAQTIRGLSTLAVPALVAAAATLAAYAPMLGALRDYKARWTWVAPMPVDYLGAVFTRYFGTGFYAILSLMLLAAGCWWASQRCRPLALLSLAVLIPVAAASWSGASYPPWAYARYFLPSLPLLLLFVAAGIEQCSAGRRTLLFLLAGLVLASWMPAVSAAQREKRDYPWPRLERELRKVLKPEDRLFALDGSFASSTACLYALYPPERMANLVGFASQTNAGGYGLLFITPAVAPSTRSPHGSVGLLHWTLYRAETRQAIARELLNDLVRTTGDRVDASLANHYQLMLILGRELGHQDADGVLTDRLHRCRDATLRRRFLPPQFLDPPPER